MNNYLITGGAGFIGSNFVRYLTEHSKGNIFILDVLNYAGKINNISNLIECKRVKFYQGNICDNSLVTKILNDCHINKIVHFAAETHVDRSILEPFHFIRTNIEGTFHLLECARQYWEDKFSDKLFLHVSTDEVFGALGENDDPFTESSPYLPNSPYAASKASSDHLVRAWHCTYRIPTIITHASNNYGPRQLPEKFIPLLILNALNKQELPIYGDGLQVRDWLYVEDHCEALLSILHNGKIGETYLISGNNEKTNINIAKSICRIIDRLDHRKEGTSSKLIRHVTDRRGHDRRYAVNSEKIQKKLNWKPKHSFDLTLQNVINWYVEHQEWCSKARDEKYYAFYLQQYKAQ